MTEFYSKSETQRITIPGHAYYNKLQCFIDNHFEIGELYLEYLKGDCKRKLGDFCDFCKSNEWVGPQINRAPRRYPDRSKNGFHYLLASKTQLTNEDGSARGVDDFQPRANIKKMFSQLKDNEHSIKEFSKQFIVDEKVVKEYVNHLHEIEVRNEKRMKRTRRKMPKKGVKYMKTMIGVHYEKMEH